ncbi:uncharacterized protein LOC127725298 isoform X1 [Mytilus californianus]|uniref:uncharacterized protein LOC127725298 isoform X1 n=1 Tax=Mytilus californianus TaxID=6549 RepID=UPI0022486577|nr:uncharacterized protein LOC127725298 isoform X1 [Mytilus californianus]
MVRFKPLKKGNGQAILTEKEIQEIRDETPFTDAEVKSLLNRYDEVDTSENNSTGLSYDDVLYMPEFIGSVFAPLVIAANVDTKTKRIYARQFIKICSILSTQIKAEEKKKYLFELLNIYGTGLLTHDEIYRMYKLLFSHTISDDHILAMTFKALNHTSLQKKGQLTKQEFFKMIPDHEIMNRMTINFRL